MIKGEQEQVISKIFGKTLMNSSEEKLQKQKKVKKGEMSFYLLIFHLWKQYMAVKRLFLSKEFRYVQLATAPSAVQDLLRHNVQLVVDLEKCFISKDL